MYVFICMKLYVTDHFLMLTMELTTPSAFEFESFLRSSVCLIFLSILLSKPSAILSLSEGRMALVRKLLAFALVSSNGDESSTY